MMHKEPKTVRHRNRLQPVSLLVLLLLLKFSVVGQSQIVQPLNDSEIRNMLINQPDYTAVQEFTFTEPKGGFGAKHKMAKFGRRVRAEEEDTIFIIESGKPTIKIYPKRREFAEVPADKDDTKDKEDIAVTPEELAERKGVNFRMLGMESFAGYECRKIEASYQDVRLKELKFIFCLAPKLKNLAVFQQSLLGSVTMTTMLSHVSLDVSEELFRIPVGYKKVEEKSYDQQFKEMIDRVKRATPSRKPIP